ncbi:hypothetical protein QO010_001593 [Caulobacter ginsengisoli]|uniref:Uncharacterized protein n=1 Tax=Caulobacter ginsengisoli TaxID=400775 RepID=A0ABU0IP96_9CAUL|nr:hypothetical protein [Caulobacter ginsengisoli]MDQ0463822.1 hypothetical protein [Caulobacter ginsengisoli]
MKSLFRMPALAMALAMAGSAAFAQITPPGLEGKDWAQTSFSIEGDVMVKITASNLTVDTINGNTTRIVLNVNGRDVVDTTAAKAETQVSYIVSGRGRYQAIAICYNHNATAYKCSVVAEKVSPDPVFK